MKFGEGLAAFIVKARWYFFGFFLLLAIASVFLMPMVGINYDMTKYLPANSETKTAIKVMSDEFCANGTASVMVTNATLDQIDSLKVNIENVNGVASVVFDSSSRDYYDGKNALFRVFFTESDFTETVSTALSKIRDICANYQVAIGGAAAEASVGRNSIGTEIPIILIIAIAIILLILLLTSKSWLEPLVYLIVIGIAILINMGTNIILGEVSFITQSISTIMLIALEMDYCIVLCSRYREEFEKQKDHKLAMKNAIAGSFLAVVSSSCTVMAGLVALMFMDYTIGFDIGAVLAKGVLISVIAVIFFMPSVILLFSKALEKTAHKSFLPKMDKLGTFAYKTRRVIPAVFLCIVIASAVLQTGMTYEYVAQAGKTGSQIEVESLQIASAFGKQNSLVVMVEKGDFEKERTLFNNICDIEVEGQKYVNTKSALVGTELYEIVTVDDLVTKFGLTHEDAVSVFAEIGKSETDTAYMVDLVKYFHLNNTKIMEFAQSKQDTVDGVYDTFDLFSVYEYYTHTQAQDEFNLTDTDQMKHIYATLLGKPYDSVTDTDVLQRWQIMEVLYYYDIDEYSDNILFQLVFEVNPGPFTQMTKQEVIDNYKLDKKVVDEIFHSFRIHESGKIRLLQLISALYQRTDDSTIILNIAKQAQASIDLGYSQMLVANEMFIGKTLSRMIFNINLDVDDKNAIAFIEKMNVVMQNSGYAKYYVANATSNLIETSNVFSSDKTKTDLITIFAIMLIVLLAFRSISIPVLLVLAIQGAIWINLTISTLMGDGIYFICYLLAMAIQMGATIDYGILLTDRYKQFRSQCGRKEAMQKALNASITTILTSGLILIIAPLIIHAVSSMPVVSEIGLMVGRGALTSVLTVLFILPQILVLFDKIIEKTTFKQKFVPSSLKIEKQNEKALCAQLNEPAGLVVNNESKANSAKKTKKKTSNNKLK